MLKSWGSPLSLGTNKYKHSSLNVVPSSLQALTYAGNIFLIQSAFPPTLTQFLCPRSRCHHSQSGYSPSSFSCSLILTSFILCGPAQLPAPPGSLQSTGAPAVFIFLFLKHSLIRLLGIIGSIRSFLCRAASLTRLLISWGEGSRQIISVTLTWPHARRGSNK